MQVSRGWQSLFRLVQMVLVVMGVITVTTEKGFAGCGGSPARYDSYGIEFRKRWPVNNVRVSEDYQTLSFSNGVWSMVGRIAPEAAESVVNKLRNTYDGQELIFFSDEQGRVNRVATPAEVEAGITEEPKAVKKKTTAKNTEADGLDTVLSEYKSRKPTEEKVIENILGTCEYETDAILGDGYAVKPSDCDKSYFVTRRVKCTTDDGVKIAFVATCTRQDAEISAAECANQKMARLIKQKIEKSRGTGATQ